MTNPDGAITDEEKTNLFMQLNLTKNHFKALMYLHISFATISDFFLDWSLLRFIVQNFNQTNVLLPCLQLLTFFPGETRQLNVLFITIMSHLDLSFTDRFMIYQIYKIKTLRASSASLDSNERLSDLKSQTINLENEIKSFWSLKSTSIGFIQQIADANAKLNGLWLESIRDFPNASKYSEEYCKFLIECTTDFDGALVQKRRAELIDLGTNFTVDYAFRFFVRAFPHYLKDGKIDLRGNIRTVSKKNGKSSSKSSGSGNIAHDLSSTGNTSSIEIDQEAENSLGKQLIRYSKMRMALHHALVDRKTRSISLYSLAIILIAVVGFAAFIGIFLFIQIQFKERGYSMERVSYLSNIRFYVGIGNFVTSLDYMNASHQYTSIYATVFQGDDKGQDLIPFISTAGRQFGNVAIEYQQKSRNELANLIIAMTELAGNGTDIYSLANELLTDSLNCTVCHSNGGSVDAGTQVMTKLPPYRTNLKNILTFEYYLIFSVSGSFEANTDSNLDREEYCEMQQNWDSIISGCTNLSKTLSESQVSAGEELSKLITILMVIIVVLVAVFSILPSFILLIMFTHEIKSYSDALLSFNSNVKKDCATPIRREVEESEILEIQEPKNLPSKKFYLLLLFNLVLAVVALVMLIIANKTNDDISLFNRWEYYAVQRLGLSIEMLDTVGLIIALNETKKETIATRAYYLDYLVTTRALFLEVNENLLQGTSTMKACFQYDDLLDEYNFKEPCQPSVGNDALHDTYKCSNSNNLISQFNNDVIEVTSQLNIYNGNWLDKLPISLIHLTSSHLWTRLSKCMDRLVRLATIYYDDLITNSVILMVVGLVLTVVAVIIAIFIKKQMKHYLANVFVFVKHVPPLQLINNKKLLNLLLNKKESKKEGISIEQSIIKNSEDGILCTGLTGVIEICNPANTEILGFTPEQLLGQPVFTFFKGDDNSGNSIQKQMDLMVSGQSNAFYEGHTDCITDRETTVPCHVTILGIQNQRTGSLESFVVMLRDESNLLQQQKEAEEAKAKSENLLFQILPRDIVVKLNAGETDITFTVPSATILFIDIVRFSDYASTLTPEQIMGNLSTVFCAYDTLIVKYNLLYKIKLIGDVYMAAGGLFNPDISPQCHADQTIRFCLDVINEMEELNMKLNSNLNVRIGVNTGGPIIAGVLGTDKPVFDIIGDPINIAARLQSTDVPGRIQIPQSTFEYVNNLGFEIEERGEVFLKGKGKTMTYFVRSTPTLLAQISTQEIALKPEYNFDPAPA